MVDEFSSKYPDARFSMETERRRPRTPFSQPSPPPSSEDQLDLEKKRLEKFQKENDYQGTLKNKQENLILNDMQKGNINIY